MKDVKNMNKSEKIVREVIEKGNVKEFLEHKTIEEIY